MSTEATSAGAGSESGLDEVQWYTPTRRIPQFIGKPPGGGTYPGGPYTVTQVVGGAAVFILGMRTQDLWGQWSWLINQAVLIAVTAGAVFALRLVKPGGRSPLQAGPAFVLAAVGTPHGTYRDRKITPAKPTRVRAGTIHALLDPVEESAAPPLASHEENDLSSIDDASGAGPHGSEPTAPVEISTQDTGEEDQDVPAEQQEVA